MLSSTHVLPEIKIDYQEKSTVVLVTETLIHMNASLYNLNKKYDAIVNEFQKQKEYMDKQLKERDEILLQVILKGDSLHKGVAKYKSHKNWWEFWKL
ncbi:hypothetical protein [Bacillus cereus group sp. BfR-BA-01354]|uniref:hypothetical protein n=1 Tax=Bacillus cereus group sp. BfR-BA-01354 TaxID=2920317 RepID=UPI001F57E332